MIFPASIRGLHKMLRYINDEAKRAGCSAEERKQIELASEEALVNIIRHAYHEHARGEIRIECSSPVLGVLKVSFFDDGEAFNPLEGAAKVDPLAPLEERPIGGLGVFLIRRLMDGVEYRRDGKQNVLTLTKGVMDRAGK